MNFMPLHSLLMIMLLLPPMAAAKTLVPLNPALADTLNEEQIIHFNLFPNQARVSRVWFEKAAWGGIIAHMDIKPGDVPQKIERSIPRTRWLEMRECASILLAEGQPCLQKEITQEETIKESSSSRRVKAWPEVAARNRVIPAQLAADTGQKYPDLKGRWLVSGGLGYQHNVSSYDEFFTDMFVFQLGFAHAITENIIPLAGFTAGFGDLNSDYEALVGDGHGSNYSAMAGLMLRAPVSQRTSIYLSGQAGYLRHSLQWGGVFEDPQSGTQVQGYAREYGDWGFSAQIGILLQKGHARKARFFDFNVGVMWGEGERWDDAGSGVRFMAEGDNAWLMFMFRFWDQI